MWLHELLIGGLGLSGFLSEADQILIFNSINTRPNQILDILLDIFSQITTFQNFYQYNGLAGYSTFSYQFTWKYIF